MRYHELLGLNENVELDEMPVAHYQTVGNFDKASSFKHEDDRKIITNPKAIAKLHKKFANNRFDFNLFFVNMPGMAKHLETGVVDAAWVEQNMPKAWPELQQNISGNSINIIFTNNSATPRYPMTAWIIAHRFGHAMDRYNQGRKTFDDVRKTCYEYAERILELFNTKLPSENRYGYGYDRPKSTAPTRTKTLHNLWKQIGGMKSARDGTLRDEFEFYHELCAEYLITGEIKLRPIEGGLITGYSFGRPQTRNCSPGDREYMNSLIGSLAETLTDEYEGIVSSMVGKILVM